MKDSPATWLQCNLVIDYGTLGAKEKVLCPLPQISQGFAIFYYIGEYDFELDSLWKLDAFALVPFSYAKEIYQTEGEHKQGK